ncbi:hypothetical protein BT63DRAFT_427369 [Microthyrium microscopicum]|uniref:mRNA 3'-end-processing protein RNA14 n=1 Tax=Microthyrium microscopicum TaxID=703497 RepID=A0A6A6U5P8_9PEZI|nr:hypothetical protein BT63DRAFT_427369 [Microthyrium microscopicum]
MADFGDEAAFMQSMQTDNALSTDPPAESNTEQVESSDAGDVTLESEEEDEDYDPSALVTPALPVSAPKPSDTVENEVPSAGPRTKGGFIVDESEDEEDVPAVGTNGMNGGNGVIEEQRSATGTPLNTSDVQIPKTEDMPSNVNTTLNVSASSLPSDIRATATPPIPNLPQISDQANYASPLPKPRSSKDAVGILEDRIKEDSRGDIEAWFGLISEYRSKGKFDDARAVYDRYFKLFPSDAELWIQWLDMELENSEFFRVDSIFHRALVHLPHVQLWSKYLDYVRRRNNLNNDADGKARQIVSQAYEFVLQTLGIDKDAGVLWREYIDFLKSGPGTPGGTGWQDQQKMDTLRKAYRQAIAIPTQQVESIWKEYYMFETQLNNVTGRKFIQEKSPAYFSAKQSWFQLHRLTAELNRSTIPRLPPQPGFDGDTEYEEQVKMWKAWIEWEKTDPIDLRPDDHAEYMRRILHVYKQATITLRFEPQFWYEAAEFCYNSGKDTEGEAFLKNGIEANPESCLLAFRYADQIEMTSAGNQDGDDAVKRRGNQVRAPYDKLLDALYDLIKVNTDREANSVARIQESFAPRLAQLSSIDDADNEDEQQAAQKALLEQQNTQINAVKAGCKAQVDLLQKTLTYTWIALMRALRRVQGKGKIGEGGMRHVFNQARKRGKLTSDVYIASALLEHYCYKDVAATKIFERGMKLFPEDEEYALEYIKHLLDINDDTNARATFEAVVNRLVKDPQNIHKAKNLYMFFHRYESNYGELQQIRKLEARMKELFPNDAANLFSHRFNTSIPLQKPFDPTSVRPVISLPAQMRPKIFQSIEQHSPHIHQDSPPTFSPRPTNAHLNLPDQQPRLSPKRPFAADPSDEQAHPRKYPRGESPFKGAAGRRVNAAKGNQQAAPSLPRDVNIFLSMLPRAEQSAHIGIPPTAIMKVLRHCNLTQGQHQAQPMARIGSGQGYQQPPQGFQPPQPYGFQQR